MKGNMVNGNPLKLILNFALPLLLGNLFQQTYNMVDAAIVGQTLGSSSLAAVGETSSVQFLVLGFCMGTCVGFGIPAFAVDTHVERICKHHDIVKKSASPLEVEQRVMEVLPKNEWLPAHQAMICFGREICHPRNPECDQYPQLYHFD